MPVRCASADGATFAQHIELHMQAMGSSKSEQVVSRTCLHDGAAINTAICIQHAGQA